MTTTITQSGALSASHTVTIEIVDFGIGLYGKYVEVKATSKWRGKDDVDPGVYRLYLNDTVTVTKDIVIS